VASYKRGPLAGIEYASERQKRNAREYYKQTGIVALPVAVQDVARGLYGQAQRARDVQRDVNRSYFVVRIAEQQVGNGMFGGDINAAINAIDKSPWFNKLWNEARARRFQPSPQLDDILRAAGMRTGLDPQDAGVRQHYMQYVGMKWDALDEMGYTPRGMEGMFAG
jgi:hypothetical protein